MSTTTKKFVDFENLGYFKSKIDENFVQKGEKIAWENVANAPEFVEPSTLTNDYYNKEEIEQKFSGMYHFKGSVATKEDLNAITNPAIGDVYNIIDTNMNAGWTGEAWDEFAPTVNLDGYIHEDNLKAVANEDIEILFVPAAEAVAEEAVLLSRLTDGGKISIVEDMLLDSSLNTREDRRTIASDAAVNFYNKQISIDVNSNTEDSANWAALYVGPNSTVTFEGTSGGIVLADPPTPEKAGPFCICNNGGDVTIKSGTYIGNGSCVYNLSGNTKIEGGFFHSYRAEGDTYFTINSYDSAYADGTSTITITGGTFVNFNPAMPKTELDPNASFVPAGYTVVEEAKENGDIWYTVVPA